jgi:ABC-type sulfate transport system permease component
MAAVSEFFNSIVLCIVVLILVGVMYQIVDNIVRFPAVLPFVVVAVIIITHFWSKK